MGVRRMKKERILLRDNYTCRYCGYDMTLHYPYPHLKVVTIDHIVPKVAGGTDRDGNLVTCCYWCNNRKRDLPVEEFLRDLQATLWPAANRFAARAPVRLSACRGTSATFAGIGA